MLDIRDWTPSEQELHARLVYLEDQLFGEYVPGRDQPPFEQRLEAWLSSPGDEDDRRMLFSLLEHLYFLGQNELDVLYRKAFRADVMWWLSDSGVSIDDPAYAGALEKALGETWFCPITDSMNIAHFHHVNGIRNRNLRPEWRTLARLGDRVRVGEYMAAKGYRRLVLLEDFVGTGTQARSSIEWALENFPECPLLICPLVICSTGFEALGELAGPHGQAEIRPGIVVPDRCTVGPPVRDGEPDDFPQLRDLLLRLTALVDVSEGSTEEKAFGFGSIGAMTVLFTNCPNNAPPALHHSDSATWSPLFPRSIRA